MRSQWQCIQPNLGTWHGSFTQFSPDGEPVKDTPSVLMLEETEPGKTMQLTLKRTPAGQATDITRRSFNYPGPAPYVLFFESGAFSQGSAQWSTLGQFGAELSLKVGDRRVRFVIMYAAASGDSSPLKYITLIREHQTDSALFTEPTLTAQQLLGEWTGRVEMRHAPMAPMATMTTGTSHWQLDKTLALTCTETLTSGTETLAIAHNPQSPNSSKKLILFPSSEPEALTYQLMCLPNGAYCLVPTDIRQGQPFRIEAGWLSADTHRARLIRYYDHRGVWMRSAYIEDRYNTDGSAHSTQI